MGAPAAKGVVIGHVLVVALVAVYAAVGVALVGLVRLLRREGVLGRRRTARLVPDARVLPARRPLAIEAAKVIRPADVLAAESLDGGNTTR